MNQTPAEKAVQLAAAHFGLNPYDLKSKARTRTVTKARHYAAHALRTVYGWSFSEIARSINDQHHTTTMYACEQVPDGNPVAVALANWKRDLSRDAGLDPSGHGAAPESSAGEARKMAGHLPESVGAALPDVHGLELPGDAGNGCLPVARNGHGLGKATAHGTGNGSSEPRYQGNAGTGLYRFSGLLTRRDIVNAVKEFGR